MPPTENTAAATLLREWIESITMRSLHEWWRYVRATGLSMPQFGVLMFLYHGGTCSVNDVGQRMEVTGAAASQLIERLVQANLVERSENPADRRARLITLTSKGRLLVKEGMLERHRWLDELVATLDEERRHAVITALSHLIDAEKQLGEPELFPHRCSRHAADLAEDLRAGLGPVTAHEPNE